MRERTYSAHLFQIPDNELFPIEHLIVFCCLDLKHTNDGVSMFLGQLLYSRTGQIFLSKLVFDGKLNVQLNDIFLEILGFFNKKTKHQKLQF